MRTALFAAVISASALLARPAFADVQLTISNGHVTLLARDATVGQIMAEWARVGRTRVVNAERIPGTPVTLELNDVPEEQALDVILRSVTGYVAAPRPTAVANASRYDRILVMPTSSPARAAAPPQRPMPPQVFPQPEFNQPPVDDVEQDEDVDEEPAPPVPNLPPNIQMPNRPPFNGFPRLPVNRQNQEPDEEPEPDEAAPQNPTTPFGTPTPAAPFGVPRPGMIVPAPQQQPGGADQQQPTPDR